MSVLAKLNLATLTVVSPLEALSIIAARGEWSALCQAVAAHLETVEAGSVVRFDSIGLSADDFKRTTATDTKAIGDVDYSGIAAAARGYGLLVKRLTDESRGFYVPRDREAIIAKVAASKAKAAAKAKAKSKSKSK